MLRRETTPLRGARPALACHHNVDGGNWMGHAIRLDALALVAAFVFLAAIVIGWF
jgi:hypothetical protein